MYINFKLDELAAIKAVPKKNLISKYIEEYKNLVLKEINVSKKFLLKDQGMTINGVKKLLNNDESLKLDEFSNNLISVDNIKIKNKLKNISN